MSTVRPKVVTKENKNAFIHQFDEKSRKYITSRKKIPKNNSLALFQTLTTSGEYGIGCSPPLEW